MKAPSNEIKNDRELVKQMQAGNQAAFALFVDRFGGQLHRLARRYAKTEADAEDLTQDIFVALTQSVGKFRYESSLGTWTYRVALNHCMKHGIRAANRPDTVEWETVPLVDDSNAHDPENRALQSELAAHVGDALSKLTDGHREVVVLHELHGLTYAECAQILDIPVGTVKSRLFHAFGKLRTRLGGYVNGEAEPPFAKIERNGTAAAFALPAVIAPGKAGRTL